MKNFQHTTQHEVKSFSSSWDSKRVNISFHAFYIFKFIVIMNLWAEIQRRISSLKLMAKLYFEISTLQPQILCSTPFKQIWLK